MSNDQIRLEVIAERPIVRNDRNFDIDIAIDLITSKSISTQATSYAINLCIVIDRSGSMEVDNKLEMAKKSCIDIYDSLNANDQLTVLAFDNDVVVVVNPQTPRHLIKERILALKPGGQTNLSKGWYLGLLELQTYATEKHINRIILLSDGEANRGEQNPSVLGAESNRAWDELGITTSTIGIGTKFQEDILSALANESGGRFWFIGEARIEDIIKEEFSGALSVFLERPQIQVELPQGIEIVRELNDLPKTSRLYRIRPIKANDQFCFALRLRIDPSKIDGDKLPIRATLLDGAGIVERTETILTLGPPESYAQSSVDERVSITVKKYLTATSEEKMIEEMDKGNVTAVRQMLDSQSRIMQDLEAKLAGSTAISWEIMTAREKAEAERNLAELRMEIEENEALGAVGQLLALMQGLGQATQAVELVEVLRKVHKHRGMRWKGQQNRGNSDDWAMQDFLRIASTVIDRLRNDFPDLEEELSAIRGRIDEQLEHFS